MRAVLERLSWHQAAVLVVAVLIIYRRYSTERPWSVAIPEPGFKPLKPGEIVKVPALPADDYSRLINLTHFRFEVNALPCDSAPAGLLLVIIVTSNPRHFVRRHVIRETWGQPADGSRLVFLVGNSSDADVARQISEESITHGDIVRGSFDDAYRNMTYKHVMGLKWVTYHCPNARYVLKADDDVAVNAAELRRFLARELGPWGSRDLIACHVLERTRVQRTFRSKWRVSPAEYPHHYYPTYCAGWAVLYSADVVKRLYAEAQKANYFWIDDAHITGMLAERAGIPRTPVGRLELSDAKLRMLTTFHYNPSSGVFLFGPPNLSVSLMTDLWSTIRVTAE